MPKMRFNIGRHKFPEKQSLPGGHVPDDKRLRTLFDYTIFHIGVYTTLVSGLLGVFAWANVNPDAPAAHFLPLHCIKWAVIFFLLAGAAGGAIVSNIAENETFESLTSKPLKVFWFEHLPCDCLTRFLHYDYVSRFEHLAFWIGILIAAVGFLRMK
jgi:hypothetical protein